MEANEQELREYLFKRIKDYCQGKVCVDCPVQDTCSSIGLINITTPIDKLLELYFRIANFVQPSKVLVGYESIKLRSSYLRAACRNCDILSFGDNHFVSLQYDLVILSLNQIEELGIDNLFYIVTDRTILIVEDIYRNKRIDTRWINLSNDNRCGITFDLYYCGVICFDLSLYKQSYIINF